MLFGSIAKILIPTISFIFFASLVINLSLETLAIIEAAEIEGIF